MFGLEVLFEHGVLMRISTDKRELIQKAVRHHNLRRLPNSLSPRQLVFSRLLRDADKLDIWRVIIMQQQEHSNLLETLAGDIPVSSTYSREIVSKLRQGESPNFNCIRNNNDLRLIRLGWVFDLNFAASCRLVLERHYIDELCSQLPDNTEMHELKEYLISYLKKRTCM